jgi:hypothetical protein
LEELLAARRLAAGTHERSHHLIGYVRLFLGACLLYTGWLGLSHPDDVPWPFLACLAIFIPVSAIHSRILGRLEFAQRSIAYYQRGLARLAGDYSQSVSQGQSFIDSHHPFSGDLDMFGAGGFFERICQARTREGEGILARWLLELAGPPEAPRRLEASVELAPRLELREQLAVLGPDLKASMRPGALRAWAVETSGVFPAATPWLYAANALSVLLIGAAICFWILSPLAIALVISAAVFARCKTPVRHTTHTTSDAGLDLRLLEGVLRLLEDTKFTSFALLELQQRIHSHGPPASVRIAKLAHLAEWIDSLDNQLFRVADHFFLFSLWFTRAADRWRFENGALVNTWLLAAGEFEALCSLAGWRFEHPDWAAPEWTEESPLFDGSTLIHPLLDPLAAVPNDARLDFSQRLLLVSGSNMSGKSTFLRTIGWSVVLAHAGAHVPASRVRLSPLHLGASIRTMDSIQEGASRFYAELQRIKAIVDLSRGPRALLFLLDELLSGTNSHDRLIGAEGIVESLLGNGAIGLVTTHDLALARIAGRSGSHAVNVHFDDRIVEGRIHFDYRMKPGVVQTSNALALMRAVGLHVGETATE